MPQAQPELKKVRRNLHVLLRSLGLKLTDANIALVQYLDKRVEVQLNGSRKVQGTLRGYDVFLNIVLDEASETKENNERIRLGMCVIRGNSVVMMEALDRIGGDDRGGRGPR